MIKYFSWFYVFLNKSNGFQLFLERGIPSRDSDAILVVSICKIAFLHLKIIMIREINTNTKQKYVCMDKKFIF